MINLLGASLIVAYFLFCLSDPSKFSFVDYFSTARDFRVIYFRAKTGGLWQLQPLNNCDAILLILSTMDGKLTRAAIRSGWLRDIRDIRRGISIQHKFVLGHVGNITDAAVISEMEFYNDLLILPFTDSYWNLSVKVGLMFKSPDVLNKCQFIVKIDGDVYVRAARFTSMIKRLPTGYPIYGGYYYDQKIRVMPVPRNASNKFSFSEEEHPNRLFNPYMGGPLYFLSNSAALRLPYTIIESSNELGEVINVPSTFTANRPPIFRLEDVFMGYIVATMVPKVTFIHIPKFIHEFDNVRQRHMVALHNVRDPTIMAQGRKKFG